MPTKQYNMWKAALPNARYVNYYGPCETTYASLYYEIDREFDDMEPLPIGHAAKNTKVLLLDTETRKEVKKRWRNLYWWKWCFIRLLWG